MEIIDQKEGVKLKFNGVSTYFVYDINNVRLFASFSKHEAIDFYNKKVKTT